MAKWTKSNNEKIEIVKKTNPTTSSGLAVNSQCAFYGIMVRTDGSNNATVTVYDNTSGAGAPLLPDSIVVLGSARHTKIWLDKPIVAQNGVFISVTCAGTFSWQVYYDN